LPETQQSYDIVVYMADKIYGNIHINIVSLIICDIQDLDSKYNMLI